MISRIADSSESAPRVSDYSVKKGGRGGNLRFPPSTGGKTRENHTSSVKFSIFRFIEIDARRRFSQTLMCFSGSPNAFSLADLIRPVRYIIAAADNSFSNSRNREGISLSLIICENWRKICSRSLITSTFFIGGSFLYFCHRRSY